MVKPSPVNVCSATDGVVGLGVGVGDVGVGVEEPVPPPPHAARKIINTRALTLIDTRRVTCFQDTIMGKFFLRDPNFYVACKCLRIISTFLLPVYQIFPGSTSRFIATPQNAQTSTSSELRARKSPCAIRRKRISQHLKSLCWPLPSLCYFYGT